MIKDMKDIIIQIHPAFIGMGVIFICLVTGGIFSEVLKNTRYKAELEGFDRGFQSGRFSERERRRKEDKAACQCATSGRPDENSS